MTTVLSRLQRVLNNPWCEFLVGLILFLTGLATLVEALRNKIPVAGVQFHHVVIFLGGAVVFRSLPAMFLGLEFLDEASPRLHDGSRPALRALDRIARSHCMDLLVGGILVAVGAADLATNLARDPVLFRLNANYGVIAFGLAPFLNAFIALYKGLHRIDRETGLLPEPAAWKFLLDRVVKNPYVTFTTGLIMLGSGALEVAATLSENLVITRDLRLLHSLILFGTFGILNALPEVFLGLRQILRAVLSKPAA